MLQRFILFWKSSTQVIHSFNENSSLKTCVTLYALSRWPQHLLMFALISDVFFGSKTYLLGDNVTRFAFATTPNNEICIFFENMLKFWIPKIYEFLDQSERVFKFKLQKLIIPKTCYNWSKNSWKFGFVVLKLFVSVRSVKKDIYFPLTENENESDLYVEKD